MCTTSGITHKFGNYIILGVNEGKYDGSETWIVAKHMAEYEKSFQRISGGKEKVSGAAVRDELVCGNI